MGLDEGAETKCPATKYGYDAPSIRFTLRQERLSLEARCHVTRSGQGTKLGVPASNLVLAGSVPGIGLAALLPSTHGHGFDPKKDGLPVR